MTSFVIDEPGLVRLCADLVRINTANPPGNEQAAAEYVAAYLAPLGFTAEYLHHEPARATLIARRRGTGNAPALVFNGHLDVVPVGGQAWRFPPFAGEVADGKLWGRGASDMKGGVAAMLAAVKAIAGSGIELRGDLVFAATAGEEYSMVGASALVESGLLKGAGTIVISEPTGNGLGLAERGVFWLELTTYGRTAHGSTPHLGVNAITMMAPLLAEIETLDFPFTVHPVLGPLTRSINMIHGGVGANVVPDRCVVTVDMRTVPGQDQQDMRRRVAEWLAGHESRDPGFRATFDVRFAIPAVETEPHHPMVERFVAAATRGLGRAPEPAVVRFATEAAIFVPALHVPTIIFGPGDPALAHQPDEHIEISAMVDAARVYAETILELL